MTDNYVDTPAPGELDNPEPVKPPEEPYRHHRGIKVKFDKSNFRFKIFSEGWTGEHWFDSFEDATKAIDKELAAEAKLVKAGRKLEIPVLTSEGQEIIVTGINRVSGDVSVRGYKDKTYRGTMYPVVPWIKAILLKLAEIDMEKKALQEKLQVRSVAHHHRSIIEVNGGRRSYGKIAAEYYGRYLEALENELKEAQEAALKKEGEAA